MYKFNLPNTTIVNRFLPKKIFEEKIKNGKKIFENINRITLIHKLSSKSINTSETKSIKEILIIEIQVKKKVIPKEAVKNISKLINSPILYKIVYEDEFCFAIFSLDFSKQFFSSWNEKKEFNFSDINLEKIYENIIKSFLNLKDIKLNFTELLKKEQEIKTLKEQIQALENKIKKQTVFKKQLELSRILKPLEIKLENELIIIQEEEN